MGVPEGMWHSLVQALSSRAVSVRALLRPCKRLRCSQRMTSYRWLQLGSKPARRSMHVSFQSSGMALREMNSKLPVVPHVGQSGCGFDAVVYSCNI